MNDAKSGREVLNNLTEQQLLDLWNRLRLFINSYYFNVDSEDLIVEAIIAVMEGRRSWNLEKSPFRNLCSIIRSIASNQITREKKFIHINPDVESSVNGDNSLISFLNSFNSELYEQQECDRIFSARLRQMLMDDVLLRRIVNYLIENRSWKPQVIADALEIDKKDVNNARKRLMRILKALRGGKNKDL